MSVIQNPKSYTGIDLETIFFRPMLSGESAQELGVRIIYNMPAPVSVQLWENQGNVLKKFESTGWSGGDAAVKRRKDIQMNHVKAEMSFAASDYFNLIYEKIACNSEFNMEDLTGSELEIAETDLFKRAIAESIRATMWVGDSASESGYNSFDGFLTIIHQMSSDGDITTNTYDETVETKSDGVVELLEMLWEQADERLRDMKGDGQLAFFCSSDIYHIYEKYLDSKGVDAAYSEMVNGRQNIAYHGIPLVDLHIGSYLAETSLPSSFCFLTDRRNLVLAVNTADFPGTEVRMWYNPDLMENRQRATFMAGCDVLDERVVSYAYKLE